MAAFLDWLKQAPDSLATAASRRAFALNEGYRELCGPGDLNTTNFAVWLMKKADGFVQREDYPIVPCECCHESILEEAKARGASVFHCPCCNHLVRFSFSGNAIHCEACAARGNHAAV
jgi:hypothetical protein